MVDLLSIRHALLVSEHLSFRRAAGVLGTSQSAVSHRVRALEDELGVALFERHCAGVRTTGAGRRFFAQVRPALLMLEQAIKCAGHSGRGEEGSLKVGIFASIASGFLRDLLLAYSSRHPGVAIEVVEGAPREHIARIRERRVDVAFVTGNPTDADCDTEQFWSERIFVVLAASHPLAAPKEIPWRRLRDERFIVSSEEPGPEIHDFIVKQLSELGHQPVVERYSVGRESLMVLVGLGLGLSLISEGGAAVVYPGVVFRPMAGGNDILPFSGVWSPDNDNPALRRFLSCARTMSRNHQAYAALSQNLDPSR